MPPALIHAVIQAESGYNPKAISEAGAIGLMQLLPGTAKRWGVTDPWDPYQNIMGGTRYLAWLLKRYNGNVELAVAAYNAGEARVDKCHCIPNIGETQHYVPQVMANYHHHLQDGIPGGVAGTLHSRRILWGGAPYNKNVCGELEYPYAYTTTPQNPTAQMTDVLYAGRDELMVQLEQRMAQLATALRQGEVSQDEMAQRLLEAIMDFDFRLHDISRQAFTEYSKPAVDEFIQRVKVEGWSTLAEYFTLLAELQEVMASASYGIKPNPVSSPEVYLTPKTARLLKGYLAQVEALLHRANHGTEAERLALAREIAAGRGLAGLYQEIKAYVLANTGYLMMPGGFVLSLANRWKNAALRWGGYSGEIPAEEGKPGIVQRALNSILYLITTGSDRFPLLKYQEIGKAMLGVGGVLGGVSLFVPDAFMPGNVAGAASAVAVLLLGIGFFLAMGLPLLPLLIWYIAVLSWYLNFITVEIAAPVWGLFHVNLQRAKVGYFVLLRLLLYPAFLVMSLVVIAALLVVNDAIIDRIIVSGILKYARSEEYILAFGALLLYAVVVIVTTVFITRLMVKMIEFFFYLVNVEVNPAVRVDAAELIARFRKPV